MDLAELQETILSGSSEPQDTHQIGSPVWNDALRLAKKHGRAVFLFTHDGRMAIGRC